jgi:transaldolase
MSRRSSRPLEQLQALLDSTRGLVFYQPPRASDAERDAVQAWGLAPSRVVIKLPAQLAGFQAAARLSDEGVAVAITAVYAASQAVLAHEVGATWVIPYVERAQRLMPAGPRLVVDLRQTLCAAHSSTRILAASIKEVQQMVEALWDGADAVSCPLTVIEAAATHELTDAAVAAFAAATGDESASSALSCSDNGDAEGSP